MEINYLAVLLSAIITMFVGFLWYNPKFAFGKQYAKLINATSKKVDKNEMTKTHVLSFVSILVFAFVLSTIFSFYEGMNALAGGIQGFMIGLGILAPIGIMDYTYARRPGKLYLITYGYYIIVSVIVGLIVGGM